MEKTKYKIEKNKNLLIVLIISSFLSLAFLFGLYFYFNTLQNPHEIIKVISFVLPYFIGLTFVIILIYFLTYLYGNITLNDDKMRIIFPQKTFIMLYFYKGIGNMNGFDSIKIEGKKIRKIKSQLFVNYYRFLEIENIQEFIRDLKSRYKKATGKDLIFE